MASWKDFEKKRMGNNINSNTTVNISTTPEMEYQNIMQKADGGDINAVTSLGIKLYLGDFDSFLGEEQSLKLSIPYLKMASDYGNTKTLTLLGMIYENGQLGYTDLELAEKYYTLAARQNESMAQYRLGIVLFLRKKEDFLHWFCCAHLNGEKEATEMLNDFLQKSNDPAGMKETIEWTIEKIKKYGIIPR